MVKNELKKTIEQSELVNGLNQLSYSRNSSINSLANGKAMDAARIKLVCFIFLLRWQGYAP